MESINSRQKEKNPLVVLLSYHWRFSKENKGKVFLYTFMFICANLIDFFPPLIIAKVLNVVQQS